MNAWTHVWRWKKKMPERFGQLCRIVVRGRMNSVLVEFVDGAKTVSSRHAIRKINQRESQVNKDDFRSNPFFSYALIINGKETPLYKVTAYDRVDAVKKFDRAKCEAALKVDDLQKTVEHAICARIHKLERESKGGKNV
ncbi:MAG: hypothetical protein LBL72_08530 [Candidatus Accumulibacter sp.]|nr:hypothetical protein [Accumulibacter sp.]